MQLPTSWWYCISHLRVKRQVLLVEFGDFAETILESLESHHREIP